MLSITCFSAPFDHPNADSIGEKFLRLPDRGAVGILAASWRLALSPTFSQALIRAFTQPGTVGEAIMQAKRATAEPIQVAMYNLLGDPAVPLAVPQDTVQLRKTKSDEYSLSVQAVLPSERFRGHAIIDWLDAVGTVISSQEQTIKSPRFPIAYQGTPEQQAAIQAMRVYVWDPVRERDGIGWQPLTPEAALLREVPGGLFAGYNGRFKSAQLQARLRLWEQLLQSGRE